MSEEMKPCPKCENPYGYSLRYELYACPDCGHEWVPEDPNSVDALVVKDANGNVLKNGDTVILVKGLPIKGTAGTIKIGTKVKKIRLVEGDHNIDCKIDGFGAMALKSEFVKKA